MAYLEAVERFGKMKDEVEGLLSERDEAYLELLAVPDTAGALLCKRPPAMLWTCVHNNLRNRKFCMIALMEDEVLRNSASELACEV